MLRSSVFILDYKRYGSQSGNHLVMKEKGKKDMEQDKEKPPFGTLREREAARKSGCLKISYYIGEGERGSGKGKGLSIILVS